jgi:hypothetical protein
MDKIANKQPIDAQSLTEAMHKQTQWRPPSSRTFDAAIGTALLPSRNGTDLGSDTGNGGRGNGPPRWRVGLPPSDPSDSSSSDEDSNPERRIPGNLLRGRTKEQRHQEEKEEDDKAKQFFRALYNWLTQPMAAEIARKPKMPEMKAPRFSLAKIKLSSEPGGCQFRTMWRHTPLLSQMRIPKLSG